MPNQVLVNSRFPADLLARIGERYELLHFDLAQVRAGTLSPEMRACRAVITTMGGQGFDHALMDQMPNLGALICYGSGYDGVDLAAAEARGIVVGNSPGANAAAVADLAMALLLSVMRRLVPAHLHVTSGGWAKRSASPVADPAPGLAGRRVGVYGMGEIGRKIALRAAAFEAEIGYTGRQPHADLAYQYHPGLDALAEWADVLIIAVRAGANTRHAVNADILAKLGPTGFVVNISRGSVIDETALVEALSRGALAGAGLDVYENEPVAVGALTALPNVALAPHIGGHTVEAHIAMQNCVLANLDAFFAGQALPYQVKAH